MTDFVCNCMECGKIISLKYLETPEEQEKWFNEGDPEFDPRLCAWCELPDDDEPQHDICCGCGKSKDTGGICDCGCSHRELCEECREEEESETESETESEEEEQ